MSLHRPLRAPSGDDAGLTLVEVMVAMVLFVLGSLSLLSVLASSLTGTHDNRARLTAANLAASDIDKARSLDYFALAPDSYTANVDGRDYSVVREVVITSASGSATSACVGSGGVKAFHKKVSTRVTTAFRGATTRQVRADTIVDAPLFDPSSTKGAIGFTVLDRTSTPLAGLAVAVPGHSRTTDSRGCAFFDALDPGDTTVTVTRSGSVTRAGSTVLSKTVKVAAGKITADSLRVDSAVTFAVGVAAYNGPTLQSGYAAPSGAVMTIAASDRSNVTRITYPSKPVTVGVDTTWTAFPSPGGYDAWLGTCSSLVGHADSEPGTSPRALIALSPVVVSLTASNNGSTIQHQTQGRTVRAVWSGGGGCSETLSWNVFTGSSCSASPETCTLNLAVPPGTWTFHNVVPGGPNTNSAVTTIAPRTAPPGPVRIEVS